ncbi:CRISPR-associated RAMP protein, Cmr4 family [Thioalkalivibrio sulfidiphilus HL-EbGr7]|uniref:CRISPR-associated RAMP protein, Cmr4 family n=1 Tax=Thioalkalivibrio sulfidiphilus (strain HL-EbGR7) TaxID=396588 RepID=B8GSH1_THISH|nr:type III-B CRISPR module RAMP protein Cmr4 [Thioalkalivibrio sulfidiphilus]ACL72875.1 CRISPR-associated RAMP protein, Cmr4 family [Thioalkalivibrio sulfidiphilus HL-EbGr7]
MHQATALLALTTDTSLHAGTGSSGDIIDLPIQREGHTGWPCVFGSAVKGALRTRAEQRMGQDAADVLAAFGPATGNASEHAGALTVGDARLLLLPVRSLTGTFRWVTCPGALDRLYKDCERLGLSPGNWNTPRVTDEDTALVSTGGGESLFLEEYRFTTKNAGLDGLITTLHRLLGRDNGVEQLEQRLTVIHDDMFSHLARTATPVNAHVALDENKTVKRGALWYEETLPPETLLYAPLMALPSRRQGHALEAGQVLKLITDKLFGDHPWLQLGGNETVGMGWCSVKFIERQNA